MSDENNGNAPDSGASEDKAQATPETPPAKGEHMIPKSRFDQVISQKKDAEAALQGVVESLVDEVPEDKRDLIPELPPAEKIKWLQKATKAGIFGNQTPASGPDSKRPGGKPPTDFDQMSPAQMMELGYKS